MDCSHEQYEAWLRSSGSLVVGGYFGRMVRALSTEARRSNVSHHFGIQCTNLEGLTAEEGWTY
jgi:hypothetical protein